MIQPDDKKQTKYAFVALGFLLIPLFAEIYIYTSSFIIGGLAEVLLGERIGSIVYVITAFASIVCAIATYIHIYRHFTRNNGNGNKETT